MKNTLSKPSSLSLKAATLVLPFLVISCREHIQKQVHYVYVNDTGFSASPEEGEEDDFPVIYPEDTGNAPYGEGDGEADGDDAGSTEEDWPGEGWFSPYGKYKETNEDLCEEYWRQTSEEAVSVVVPFAFYDYTEWGPVVWNSEGLSYPLNAYFDLEVADSEYIFICPMSADGSVFLDSVSEVKYEDSKVSWYSSVFSSAVGEVLLKWGIYDSSRNKVYWRAPEEGGVGVDWVCSPSGEAYVCEDQKLAID